MLARVSAFMEQPEVSVWELDEATSGQMWSGYDMGGVGNVGVQ